MERMTHFKIPKAKSDSEAPICMYMSLADNKEHECNIEPSECSLSRVGHISKNGREFEPIKKLERGIYVSVYRCPKLENGEEK